jgi:hypothetical protein
MPLSPEPPTRSGSLASIEAQVAEIVTAAGAEAVPVRVLGSIGVAIRAPGAVALLAEDARTYGDIDLAAYRRDARALARVLTGLGYIDDREIAITSEGRRAIFDRPDHRFHIDVFFDRLDFCHVIPLAGRLEAEPPTIPLAELLLSKLQIVKINRRDLVDLVALLLDVPLGTADDAAIDLDRVARLCADEWGLWRTVSMNLAKVGTMAATLPPLGPQQRNRVAEAIATLKTRIDDEPKPLAWKIRARVGDRRQWWTDVDEVR